MSDSENKSSNLLGRKREKDSGKDSSSEDNNDKKIKKKKKTNQNLNHQNQINQEKVYLGKMKKDLQEAYLVI